MPWESVSFRGRNYRQYFKPRKMKTYHGLNKLNYVKEEEYKRRSYLLKTMGYKSYREYLNSSRWKRICFETLSKHKKCSICGSHKDLVPHHLMYSHENMTGISTNWIVVICTDCHSYIHEIEQVTSYTPMKATLIYLEMNYPKRRFDWIKKPPIIIAKKSKGAYRRYGVFGMQAKGLM